MNWIRVPRPRTQPAQGGYADWKPQILASCGGQCVYCCITEGEYGGIDNFHVEHFRPKSLFNALRDAIDNLFAACAICNRFKSDEWPGEPDPDAPTFLDPSETDYHQHFEIDGTQLILTGTSTAGKFMVERLFLNRPQLLLRRRVALITAQIKAANSVVAADLARLRGDNTEEIELIRALAEASLRISTLQASLSMAAPYAAHDIRRPARVRRPRRR